VPSRVHLEDHSATSHGGAGRVGDVTPVGRSSVEIALRVLDDTCEGLRPVCAAGKAVEQFLFAAGPQFEHHSASEAAVVAGPDHIVLYQKNIERSALMRPKSDIKSVRLSFMNSVIISA
jgi:hypothetical protein